MACQLASSNQRCAGPGRSPRGSWAEGAGIGTGLHCAALSMAVASATATAAAANAAVAAVVVASEGLCVAGRCRICEGVALRRANSACGTSFASGCRKPEEGARALGLDGAVEGEEADEKEKENGVALAEREEKEDDDTDDGRRWR